MQAVYYLLLLIINELIWNHTVGVDNEGQGYEALHSHRLSDTVA
jgi:hypothetical protein